MIGANGGPRSPGTAYILLHHCMGGVNGHRGLWGFVRGGMGAVSNAIADSARSRGAVIRTNSPVEKIVVRQGRARGVVLKSGEEIAAGLVASNLDPKKTFLDLLDAAADLDPEFVDGIRKFRIEGTSLKMNLALNGLPEFLVLPGDPPGAPGPQHRATMHLCPSVEYIERAWDDAKYGRPSQSPLIEMTIPTMYDPSLAPEGRHIMGIFLQYAPYTLAESTWDREREPYSERILDVIEEYCPNIRNIVVEQQTLTPLDLERRFRHYRRKYFPRRNGFGPDVRPAAHGRLGALPDTCQRAVLVRLRRASRRRSDGRAGTQRGAGDAAGFLMREWRRARPVPVC